MTIFLTLLGAGIATPVAGCYDMDVASLGDRIADLRRAAGLTRAELARRAHMTGEGLRKIETGETQSPTYEVRLRLAAVFGLTPDELTGEEAGGVPPPADYDLSNNEIEPKVQVNLHRIRKLSPRRYDELIERIDLERRLAEREANE